VCCAKNCAAALDGISANSKTIRKPKIHKFDNLKAKPESTHLHEGQQAEPSVPHSFTLSSPKVAVREIESKKQRTNRTTPPSALACAAEGKVGAGRKPLPCGHHSEAVNNSTWEKAISQIARSTPTVLPVRAQRRGWGKVGTEGKQVSFGHHGEAVNNSTWEKVIS